MAAICSACRMTIPYGALVCPHCHTQRRAAGGEEARTQEAILAFLLSAVVFGAPLLWAWSRLPMAKGYPLAWCVILPLAGVIGYKVVRRYPGPAVLLSFAYMVGWGVYMSQ